MNAYSEISAVMGQNLSKFNKKRFSFIFHSLQFLVTKYELYFSKQWDDDNLNVDETT